jgi:hypothetical protein
VVGDKQLRAGHFTGYQADAMMAAYGSGDGALLAAKGFQGKFDTSNYTQSH